MDPYKFLNIKPNPDGSLTRDIPFPDIPPTGYNNTGSAPSQTVATIDVPLNTSNNTWIRIYHPLNLPPNTKLPVIIYFHGGGFILFTSAMVLWHELCLNIATNLPAIILSVNYRLAPEHRLPAAYEDAVDAMLWVKQQALRREHEFCHSADFTKCFLMGSSSGGNIVFHAGLSALALDLVPVKIAGLIANIPFFGGVERSSSEVKYANDRILPLPVADLMWELSVPIGADRDHEYASPMRGGAQRSGIEKLPRCYVNGYDEDPLVDREKEFVEMLKGHAVDVVARFGEGGYHAVELFDAEKVRALVMDLKDFCN